MQEKLNLALVQTHLHWENPPANRSYFSSLIEKVPADTDIIILPEMFTTGFSMNPKNLAEDMDGPTGQWMQSIAKEKQMAICGSAIIKVGKDYFNRFLFVTPSGETHTYDKRHTFNMAGEGEVYTVGNAPVIVTYLGWKFCLQICYDLRFPVFARNTSGYDALLYVANWPKTRIQAWDALLKARAIENMCYSVGVNRVGLDGNNLEYVGHSAVYNILGDTMAIANDKEQILPATLHKSHIDQTRSQLPFLQDRDHFDLL